MIDEVVKKMGKTEKPIKKISKKVIEKVDENVIEKTTEKAFGKRVLKNE